jgi:hypothetical protein
LDAPIEKLAKAFKPFENWQKAICPVCGQVPADLVNSWLKNKVQPCRKCRGKKGSFIIDVDELSIFHIFRTIREMRKHQRLAQKK